MSRSFNRRRFLKQSATLSAAAFTGSTLAAQQPAPPRAERLRLGIIGVNGRGGENLNAVAGEQIVALCDVDVNRAAGARRRFPKAVFVEDYRRLLDRRDVDAVVISTPDHTHAVIGVAAMRAGKHVYCEKPLAHSVHEVRTMIETAARHKVKTQMGTQIHAGENYRQVVEILRAGIIGPIRRVQVWCSTRPQPGYRSAQPTPPPAGLNYDLWLGPAPYRPYHSSHLHFHWRWWWDFGGGVLADMACHYMDLPHWALNLRTPLTVRANGRVTHQGDNRVPTVMQVDYEYAARGAMPPVHLTWYHGVTGPDLNGQERFPGFGSGVLFVGERGNLLADYTRHRLLPEERFANFQRPPASIPRSVGHHREWLDAIRNNGTTTCAFEYSGPLALTVLLGNVAYRAGEQIRWGDQAGRVTNTQNAEQYLRREYRRGWSL
jgi:predicted dehydrogenase